MGQNALQAGRKDMEKLEATFKLEKETKNTGRYSEDLGAGPPIMNTIYVQKWALTQLGGGSLPDKIRVVITKVDV